MRKKVLVLFLTLSMVLSFMPMIAFADAETEGPLSAREKVEAEMDESEEQTQENVDAEGVDAPADEAVVDEEMKEKSADEAVVDEGTKEKPADENSTDIESSDISPQQTIKGKALNALADDDQKSYVDEITGCINQTVKRTYYNSSFSFSDVQSSDTGVVIAQLTSSGMTFSDRMYYSGTFEFYIVGQGTAEVTLYAGGFNAGTIKVVAYDHEWDSEYVVDIEPTCTEEGSQSIHCVRCGESKDEEAIPALGHDWDSEYTVDIEPTCTEEGSQSIYCARCGESEEEAIPALGHEWDSEYTVDIEPTCTEEGSQSIYCARCGESKDEEAIPALGHDWDSEYTVDIEPTCTEEGSQSIYCARCGESKDEEVIPALGHDYDSNNVCERCGETKCTHENTYESYVWEPDEVECKPVNNKVHRVKGPGELETRCEDCDAVIKSVKVNIDNEFYHDYDSNHKCTECGHPNTCKHPSKYFEYYYDTDECKIEATEDGKNHTVEGDIEKITWCKECEERLKTEELGKTKVTEIHYYNIDDDCIYCDYHNPKVRIFGKLRYDTAIAAAEKYRGSSGKFDNVIVAYGRNFPDALSGGYLAKVKNAPILLVEPSEEGRIVDYISQNIASGGRVYILGGTGVVSSAFEKKVKAKNISTERLGGATRYETNLAILKAAGVKDEDILVCTGAGYADSLSASAVGKPILLVGNTLTDDQKSYIKDLSSKQFYLIGGTGAVKRDVEKDLKEMGFKPERLWGQTRYETSTAVAKKFFETAKTVILAYAKNFPDGLSGGPLAMLKDAPIVLTDSNTTAAAKDYVKSAGIVNSITLGGPALISDIAVKTIMGR